MIELQRRQVPLALPFLLMLSPSAGHAQSHSSAVDFAVIYATTGTQQVNGSTRWAQGGSAEVHARIYRALGVVAEVTGQHAGSSSAQTAPISFVTVVFGPRLTLGPHNSRISIFGQALVGEANGFQSLFAIGSGQTVNPGNGTKTSASALAFQVGGGLDIRLNRHVSLRLVQADYLRTQFPNGGTNTQNNLRLAMGFSFRH
jgi:hypothetical protein